MSVFCPGFATTQAGDGICQERGTKNKSSDSLARDDSFSRMIADCKLEHVLLYPPLETEPSPCMEDGAVSDGSDGLARHDSFSRMLSASTLQTPPLGTSTQPVPSLPPPPSPSPLQPPPDKPPGKVGDTPNSPTRPAKTAPQLDGRGATKTGGGPGEPSRRPRFSALRVWDGPASQPPSAMLSSPSGAGVCMSRPRGQDAKAFHTLSPDGAAPENTWSRRSPGSLPPGTVPPRHARNGPRFDGSSPPAGSFGDGTWGGRGSQPTVMPMEQPSPIRQKKRKSPEWDQEHPVGGARIYCNGGNGSPASHDNPDWFGGSKKRVL